MHVNQLTTDYIILFKYNKRKPPRTTLSPYTTLFRSGGAQATRVTGQWDFDQGDLRATVGQALEYGDGDRGRMGMHTWYCPTSSYGIPVIGGQVARVMKYESNETTPDNYVAGFIMNYD